MLSMKKKVYDTKKSRNLVLLGKERKERDGACILWYSSLIGIKNKLVPLSQVANETVKENFKKLSKVMEKLAGCGGFDIQGRKRGWSQNRWMEIQQVFNVQPHLFYNCFENGGVFFHRFFKRPCSRSFRRAEWASAWPSRHRPN